MAHIVDVVDHRHRRDVELVQPRFSPCRSKGMSTAAAAASPRATISTASRFTSSACCLQVDTNSMASMIGAGRLHAVLQVAEDARERGEATTTFLPSRSLLRARSRAATTRSSQSFWACASRQALVAARTVDVGLVVQAAEEVVRAVEQLGARSFIVIDVAIGHGHVAGVDDKLEAVLLRDTRVAPDACSGMCEMMLASMRTWGLTMAQSLSLLTGRRWRRAAEQNCYRRTARAARSRPPAAAPPRNAGGSE